MALTERNQALDGLRGLSVLLVVISHCGYGDVIPGGLGVTVFFFISGYIITHLLLLENEKYSTISIKNFYLRRLFRITPALFVYIFASTLFITFMGGRIDTPHIMASLFYYYNYYFLYFFDHHGFMGTFHPYSIVWSLTVEEHYYIVYPFLFYFTRSNPKLLLRILVAVCLFELAWRAYLVYSVGQLNLPYARIYKGTDTRIDSIAYGAVLALAMQVSQAKLISFLKTGASALVGVILLLSTLVIRDSDFRESLRYTLQGISVCLIFSYAINIKNWISHTLSWKPLVFIGKISYSLYLWHWLCFVAIERLTNIESQPLFAALILLMSFVTAYFSQKYIEEPFLKLGRRHLSKAVSSGGTVSAT